MEAKPSMTELEDQFVKHLVEPPYPVDELLAMITACDAQGQSKKATEWTALLLQAQTEAFDFSGAYQLMKARADALSAVMKGAGFRDALKKSTKDRLTLAILDSVSFGDIPVDESFRRLDLLLALTPGTLVLDNAWGVGEIKRMDYFYKKATIDFRAKKNHAMTFAAVTESVRLAPANHILTVAFRDPARVTAMVADEPGELVKAMLRSFGDMPILRLEDLCAKYGFVPTAKWKAFWESARAALKHDKLVVIPARRNDNLELRAEVESYGDVWFARLAKNTDIHEIMDAVLELESTDKVPGLSEAERGVLEDRLAFAVKGAHHVDDALYARLACAVSRLGFLMPPLDDMRAYLWQDERYIAAANAMAVKDIAAMITFLLAGGGSAENLLLEALPRMSYSLMAETLDALKTQPATHDAVRALLMAPKAPPALVHWVFRFRATLSPDWRLPSLIDLLTQAIILVEGRLNGEALRMQNNIRALFNQPNSEWLEAVFHELNTVERVRFFERIQASIAWDPSTHRTLVARMMKIDPTLTASKKSAAAQQSAVPVEKITSLRSYTLREKRYQRLVNVEMPANVRDIQEAKEKGDLSENAEYQYAKDKEKMLLQKQAVMQEELNTVKAVDFASVDTSTAMPGTTVVLAMPDGSKRTYTILGEWDSDETLGIIADKTRLAQNILGRAPGATIDVPTAEGDHVRATLEAVQSLNDAVRAWIHAEPELS